MWKIVKLDLSWGEEDYKSLKLDDFIVKGWPDA